jgi:hypothetical protein
MRRAAASLLALALLAAPLPAVSAAGAAGPRSPDYVIKAAYLYNFALFVEWPADAFASADAPFVIGILGSDPFGDALTQIVSGKRINRRRIHVEVAQYAHDLRRAQLVFVSAADAPRLAELLVPAVSSGTPQLVVGETDVFLRHGGTISFTVRDNKVGYDINLEAARKARLVVSSKLLSLAGVVRR